MIRFSASIVEAQLTPAQHALVRSVLAFILVFSFSGSDAAAQDPEQPLETTASDPVEEDAQAYTHLVLRHDFLVFKEDRGQGTAAERNEMAQIRAEGEKIKSKYAPGGLMSGQAAAYQNRVAELSRTVVAAAKQKWMADAFPDAAAVAGGFSTDAERLAALKIMLNVLDYRAKLPAAAAMEKRRSYQRAMDKISPPAKFDADLFEATKKLQESPRFRLDVISRFAPVFAPEAQQKLKQAEAEAVVEDGKRWFWTSMVGVCLLTLAGPVVVLIWGQRQWLRPGSPNSLPAFQLPRELAKIKVFRKSYWVTMDCGQVTSKKPYTEVQTWTTRTPGGEYQILDTVYRRPDTYTTHKQSTERTLYVLRTPDGRDISRDFEDWRAPLEVGDMVSLIEHRRTTMLGYNHSRNGLTYPMDSRKVHDVGGLLWLLSFGVPIAGFMAIHYLLVPRLTIDPVLPTAIGWWMLLMLFISAVYVAIIRTFVVKIREKQFDSKWEPRLKKFMEERTEALQQNLAKMRA